MYVKHMYHNTQISHEYLLEDACWVNVMLSTESIMLQTTHSVSITELMLVISLI